MPKILLAAMAFLLTSATIAQDTAPTPRPRSSDLGLKIGLLPAGSLDAITDVAGVEVGHTTLIRSNDVRTGVTAILPHPGNLFREKVPGAVFVGNAFGKLAGSTQVNELGEIETPILLTSTLSVPRVADALIDYMLALPPNGRKSSAAIRLSAAGLVKFHMVYAADENVTSLTCVPSKTASRSHFLAHFGAS
jgi:D-aminopeptidase